MSAIYLLSDMTTLMDGALDLSAKQVTGRDVVKREGDDDVCARECPAKPMVTTVGERRSTCLTPEPDSKRPAPYTRPNAADSPDSATDRPLKKFDYGDSLPGMYAAAAAAAAAQMGGQLYPYGAGGGTGLNCYNNAALYAAAAAASATSPISQFLQQRKRRASPPGSEALFPDAFDDADDLAYHKRQRDGVAETKDEAYWERRRKNNEAAKRSRDMRRAKEEEIALRAACLEQENLKLRAQVAILKNDTAKLHYMLYNRL